MELELKVEGMTCDGCSSRVADALKVLSQSSFCNFKSLIHLKDVPQYTTSLTVCLCAGDERC